MLKNSANIYNTKIQNFMKKDRNLHYFDKRVAKKFTINAAIVLNNIDFWIKANKEQNKAEVFKNGRWWTYSTISDYSKVMSYLSKKQIEKSLNDLKTAGLLIKDCFNQNAYDRTAWYSIDYALFGEIFDKKVSIDFPSEGNGNYPQGKSSYKENIKENVEELQDPQILKNPSNTKPNTNTLKDGNSNDNPKVGAALINKVHESKEPIIKNTSNNSVKPSETASEQTNAVTKVCLYTELSKNALNAYNEIAKRKYTFKRHGSVIIKRLKAEFSKEEVQDSNTFELIKTMLEVKFQDTVQDNKGFALLPLRNYEPQTLFSPSKFSKYLQAAENVLIQKQKRKIRAAENKNINPFAGII